ncbi:hypothetical protein D3C78_712770 [compost metagenome]
MIPQGTGEFLGNTEKYHAMSGLGNAIVLRTNYEVPRPYGVMTGTTLVYVISHQGADSIFRPTGLLA